MTTADQTILNSIDTITARLAVVNESIAEATTASNDHQARAQEHRLRADALKRERETLNLALREAQRSQRVKSIEEQVQDELAKTKAAREELDALLAQAKSQLPAAASPETVAGGQ